MFLRSDLTAPGTLLLTLLILGSALAYTASMVAMKVAADNPRPVLLLAIVVSLILAVLLEVMALRSQRLGMIYVSILGAEVVLIALATVLIFGETFTTREMAGCALVIAGTALAWS